MNKNKSPVWKMIILIIEALAEMITAFLIISKSLGRNDDGSVSFDIDSLVPGICIWIFLLVTIGGFVRWKSGKKYILLTGAAMKLILASFAAGFVVWHSISAVPGIALAGAGLAGYIAALVISKKNAKNSDESGKEDNSESTVTENNITASSENNNSQKSEEIKNENELSAFRLNWVIDRTTSEYCTANNKISDKLTADDYKAIKKYGCVPISYLFAWLVKHDHCSGYFISKYDLNWIKTENSDPSIFVASELDGIINYSAFSDNIRAFIDYYYNPSERFISGSGHTFYQDDYYSVIRNPWRVFFNIDFSWDLYHKLEKKIDERYEYFLRDIEWKNSDIYDNSRIAGQIYSDKLSKYFDLYIAEGVSEDYVMKCTHQIKNMSDEMYDNLYQKIYYAFIEPFSRIKADYKDSEMVFESLESGSIIIPVPHGEEPAYILGFETDFEREHGIAITIRDDEIIDTSYRMDADSPWCSINEMNYRLEKSVKNLEIENIDAISKALLEYSKGNLEQTVLIPSFVKMPVPEENRLFVPAPAFELKNRYDVIAEKMLSEGSADRYECKPGYKEGSIVPSYIRICLYKSGTVVFSESIQIW